MKITLNSNNEIHRKIAKLFGELVDDQECCFIWYNHRLDSDGEYLYDSYDSIAIDLATAEPDLRLAIGLPMEFVVNKWNKGIISKITKDDDGECFYELEDNGFSQGDFSGGEIKLSREWLESQDVKVEDK